MRENAKCPVYKVGRLWVKNRRSTMEAFCSVTVRNSCSDVWYDNKAFAVCHNTHWIFALMQNFVIVFYLIWAKQYNSCDIRRTIRLGVLKINTVEKVMLFSIVLLALALVKNTVQWTALHCGAELIVIWHVIVGLLSATLYIQSHHR